MKKVSKIIIAILVVMIVTSLIAPVFAIDPTEITIDTKGTDKIKTISGNVIGIVQVVGTAIAVVMLIVLGIKYVIAAPSEKAEIKKSAFIYVVAAVLLFGAVNILAMIQDWTKEAIE